MRIHTYLTENEIRLCMLTAKRKGKVAEDVHFDPLARYTSRSREHAWEVQLGSSKCGGLPEHYVNMYGKRQKTRRTRNSSDMVLRYAATWHEWGWFLNEIFDMDSTAHVGRIYKNRLDFDKQTKYQFNEQHQAEPPIDPIVFYTGSSA